MARIENHTEGTPSIALTTKHENLDDSFHSEMSERSEQDGCWLWSLNRTENPTLKTYASPRKKKWTVTEKKYLDTTLRKSTRKRMLRKMDPCMTEYYQSIVDQVLSDKARPDNARSPTEAVMVGSSSKTRPESEQSENQPKESHYLMDEDSDAEDNMERRRKKNLEDNAKFLASLGIGENFTTPRMSKPQKKIIRRSIVVPPRAKSLRLRHISVDGAEISTLSRSPAYVETVQEPRRNPSGPLALAEHTWGETDLSRLRVVMAQLAHERPTVPALSTLSQDRHIRKLKALWLNHFVKATPKRIFSIGFHPSSTKLFALAGDTLGHLAFWDVIHGEKGMRTFTPHRRPLNHIVCPPTDHSRVYTASYDGTLRVTSLELMTFDEVYATEESDDIKLTRFDFLSPESIVVSQSDGNVAIVDTRTTSTKAENLYPLHNRPVKCVNVHPVQKQYFLTATNSGSVALWDLRMLVKKCPKSVQFLPHSKCVSAAHFSPVSGNRVLTTCSDDTLTVYDSSTLTNISKLKIIKHNNATGRWLTNLRAEWHPLRDDLFVIGSLHSPRQIELYSSKGDIVHTYTNLTSVCSLNVFHPTISALVGATSSGRLVAYL